MYWGHKGPWAVLTLEEELPKGGGPNPQHLQTGRRRPDPNHVPRTSLLQDGHSGNPDLEQDSWPLIRNS